jgi:hypothetical protein
MSHDLDSPLARQYIHLDITDLYVFRGEIGTVFAINVCHLIFGPVPEPDYHPEGMRTETAFPHEPERKGFHISRSALTLRAQVPYLDERSLARMASDAEKTCPVSPVLSAAIALDAKPT